MLYDKEGNIHFYSAEETKKILITYEKFTTRRTAFREDPKTHAYIFLGDIRDMKRVPECFRFNLPDYFELKDKDLDKLERECKKHIPEGLLEL